MITLALSLIPLISPLQAPQTNASDATLAWGIAAQTLMRNTVAVRDASDPTGEKQYLLAGAHQFYTLWARDFAMSAAGALALGQYRAVRDSLEVFYKSQRPDGLLPRTIDNVGINRRVILGLAGMPPAFKAPLKAWFKTENGVLAIDTNVVLPWAASEYVLASHDRQFALRWLAGTEAALGFLEKNHFVDGLVGKQPPFSDWADSIRRQGRVALTNIYYILALRGVADWAEFLELKDKAGAYRARAAVATRKFHDFFWDGEKKRVRNFEGDDHLTADANLMAVAYHVLNPEESAQVMNTLRASPLWWPMPGRATTPNYPRRMKSFNVKLAGIASYHDAMTWLWITAVAARAERAIGNCAGYHEVMDKLAARINNDGTVYEVFDLRKGRLIPVKRLLYSAEQPFTWSSAQYLEAAQLGCHSGAL